MKLIKKIPHVDVDITLYEWNQKFILKFELNGFEQTYKVSQFEIEKYEEVEESIKPEFVEKVLHRFHDMQEEWDEALGMTL